MGNNFTANYDGVSDHVEYLCETEFPAITGPAFILIFMISVIGNGLLLCVLFIYENLKSVTNIFILNLACSDLIFTFTLPFWATDHLHHWVFGDFVCKFMTAAYFVGLYSSVILLTAMTVDRWRYAIGSCVAAWVISISASIRDAMKVKVELWDDVNYCENGFDDKFEHYLQVFLLFFFPFAIIIFCYAATLKTVLQGLNRKKHRTVAMLLCIVLVFFICWGPYHILLLIRSLYKLEGCEAQERLDIAYHICEILAYSHCCMNPLLYTFSQKLRKHLLKVLQCKNACRRNQESSTSKINKATSVTQEVALTELCC